MLTDENFDDLEVNGYTFVKDVLTPKECDAAISEYQEWLAQFKDGDWPITSNSLIFNYNLENLAPTWYVRLKTKNVFAQLWKTDKLLTSVDTIAIGRPPEDGEESFHVPGDGWLHVDQSAYKAGLHAYQGAVYLEEACKDDWTFQVLEGSHMHFNKIFEDDLEAREESNKENHYRLNQTNLMCMEQQNCAVTRVPVPKGGMVIWDSRLVHANASPLQGRSHPGRWRYVVFVSMTPAIWATKWDIEEKRRAYRHVLGSTHWSSQGIAVHEFDEGAMQARHQSVSFPRTLPDLAKSEEAKLLAGVVPYDFEDGKPTGFEKKPTWLKPDF